jgi:hypothetical protein
MKTKQIAGETFEVYQDEDGFIISNDNFSLVGIGDTYEEAEKDLYDLMRDIYERLQKETELSPSGAEMFNFLKRAL